MAGLPAGPGVGVGELPWATLGTVAVVEAGGVEVGWLAVGTDGATVVAPGCDAAGCDAAGDGRDGFDGISARATSVGRVSGGALVSEEFSAMGSVLLSNTWLTRYQYKAACPATIKTIKNTRTNIGTGPPNRPGRRRVLRGFEILGPVTVALPGRVGTEAAGGGYCPDAVPP